jgi:hypothetical protein
MGDSNQKSLLPPADRILDRILDKIMDKEVGSTTAKLLKSKGFDGRTTVWHQHGNGVSGCVEGKRDHYNRKGDAYTAAPSIAEVVMWLYENHDFWIKSSLITVNGTVNFFCSYFKINKGPERTLVELPKEIEGNYISPEEAYEAAIVYVLENLIPAVERTPTAGEFLSREEFFGFNEVDIKQAMVKFAKFHVEAALKAAAENAKVVEVNPVKTNCFNQTSIPRTITTDKESILESYPLEKIK